MRFTKALVVTVLAAELTACKSVTPSGTAGSGRACLAENPVFADAWSCLRARTVARGGGVRDGFVQEGDLLAEQVKSGKVSEQDARKRLANGLAHDSGL